METLQTYVNTKEISCFLINVQEIKMLPSIFFRVTIWHMHKKFTMICLIIFIKISRNLHLQYLGGTQIDN